MDWKFDGVYRWMHELSKRPHDEKHQVLVNLIVELDLGQPSWLS